MRLVIAPLVFGLAMAAPVCIAQARGAPNEDEFAALLERLRKESAGEYDKVVELAKTDRTAALRFLRERFGTKGEKSNPEKQPKTDPSKPDREKVKHTDTPLAARSERFTVIETLHVGDFSIDLCRRDDGAFGLGEVRKGKLPLRRADALITWQVDGQVSRYERRKDATVWLRDPKATLTFTPERRECAGTTLRGFRMRFECDRGPVVETASWELGAARGTSATSTAIAGGTHRRSGSPLRRCPRPIPSSSLRFWRARGSSSCTARGRPSFIFTPTPGASFGTPLGERPWNSLAASTARQRSISSFL
jgi:hypothetical protein